MNLHDHRRHGERRLRASASGRGREMLFSDAVKHSARRARVSIGPALPALVLRAPLRRSTCSASRPSRGSTSGPPEASVRSHVSNARTAVRFSILPPRLFQAFASRSCASVSFRTSASPDCLIRSGVRLRPPRSRAPNRNRISQVSKWLRNFSIHSLQPSAGAARPD
jgi:hypothetical protein